MRLPACTVWTAVQSDLDRPAPSAPPLSLALGIFDGVHRGHLRVLDAALADARRRNGLFAVLTFDPHPSRLLRPEAATRLFTPPAEKIRRLLEAGADCVLWKAFTADFAAIRAEDFLPRLKKWLPSLASIFVGENFRFGQKRKGDISVLQATAPALGLAAHGIPRLEVDALPISSSRIREALLAADLPAVAAMLGRPYSASGTVQPGRQLGRTLGFPTLNLPWAPELAPPFGVYATTVRDLRNPGAPPLPAVSNYGRRPTVSPDDPPLLETHLLTPACPFTTGSEIEVAWHTHMRPERTFPSLEALRAQIQSDTTTARSLQKTLEH
jgi:riboflavin kinase/FMN adenylyltransferase